MPHISFRVTDEEKRLMDNYAKINSVNLSDAIKNAFFEKLEDDYDLEVVRQYEAKKKSGEEEFLTLQEVKKELGI